MYHDHMTPFQSAWNQKSTEKKSRLVAGLDPAPFVMGKDEQGLPEEINLLQWGRAYIDAVAPHAPVLKYNGAFFQHPEGAAVLPELITHAKAQGLLIIADVKVSDIDSSNDAWCFGHRALGADAITIAPYAANLHETIVAAKRHQLATIIVCVMSNPEYEREMHATDPKTGEALYQLRTRVAVENDADAIVVGGTYDPEDPILTYVVSETRDTPTLYLIPGIGAQGGSVEQVFTAGLDPDRCLFSASRSLMFPNGSNSTPEEQEAEAKRLQALTFPA